MRAIVIATLVGVGAVLVVLAAWRTPPGPTPEELARRTATCQPTWQNYQEDIKGQIGAGLVAEWAGKPEQVRRDGAILRVRFQLEGAWGQRTSAIPILLREPGGSVHRNRDAECRAGRVTYVFELGEGVAGALPWIELKYPHGEKRLVLFEDGSWASPS